ncbi:MAG: hypothetical protein ACTHKH_08705, partial [Trinickia sp.]
MLEQVRQAHLAEIAAMGHQPRMLGAGPIPIGRIELVADRFIGDVELASRGQIKIAMPVLFVLRGEIRRLVVMHGGTTSGQMFRVHHAVVGIECAGFRSPQPAPLDVDRFIGCEDQKARFGTDIVGHDAGVDPALPFPILAD